MQYNVAVVDIVADANCRFNPFADNVDVLVTVADAVWSNPMVADIDTAEEIDADISLVLLAIALTLAIESNVCVMLRFTTGSTESVTTASINAV